MSKPAIMKEKPNATGSTETRIGRDLRESSGQADAAYTRMKKNIKEINLRAKQRGRATDHR